MRTSANFAFTAVLCLVIGLVGQLAAAIGAGHLEWLAFKSNHGKSYPTLSKEAERFENFLKNREQIIRHNANPNSSYKLGLNHLADWSHEELAKLNGLKFNESNPNVGQSPSLEASAFLNKYLNDDKPVPAEVDWRKVPGRVASVHDQGQCGSCWAFATVGVLEGQEIPTGFTEDLYKLSEQNLVDCSKKNYGCNGGIMSEALADIADEGGIEVDIVYPAYSGKTQACRYKGIGTMTDKGGVDLPANDEEALKKMVANYGPVSVALYADYSWFSYKSGIYDDNLRCSKTATPNHGVLVVGYGTDPKHGDYWIIKNSWSAKWGEAGYIRIKRGVNMCAIGRLSTIAVF